MADTRKTIITVETWRRTVLSRRQISTLRCELCAAEVVMLSTAQAAQISNDDEPTIIRRIERGELHFIKTNDDNLLICSQSLSTKNYD